MNLTTPQLLELKAQIKIFRETSSRIEALLNAASTPRKCENCSNYTEKGNHALCMKWNSEPPEDVQKIGCDYWEYDDIPF